MVRRGIQTSSPPPLPIICAFFLPAMIFLPSVRSDYMIKGGTKGREQRGKSLKEERKRLWALGAPLRAGARRLFLGACHVELHRAGPRWAETWFLGRGWEKCPDCSLPQHGAARGGCGIKTTLGCPHPLPLRSRTLPASRVQQGPLSPAPLPVPMHGTVLAKPWGRWHCPHRARVPLLDPRSRRDVLVGLSWWEMALQVAVGRLSCRSTPCLLPLETKSSAPGSPCLKAPAVRNALEMGLQVAPAGRDVHNLWR